MGDMKGTNGQRMVDKFRALDISAKHDSGSSFGELVPSAHHDVPGVQGRFG